MNRRLKYIFGTATMLCLAAFGLSAQNMEQFGNLPLWFEAGSPATFIAHGAKSEFVVRPDEVEFTLVKASGKTASGSLCLVGANTDSPISGTQKLAGKINYLIGNAPDKWMANIPTFSQVQVENVYPGVNVVYYGNQRQLEYDFNLAAGADPSAIVLRFKGAEKLSVNPRGELVIQFKTGEVVQHSPVAYQTVAGRRQEVAVGYKIVAPQTAAFALASYDRRQPLVIDPVLTYSTYFGGNQGDNAWAVAVNPKDGSIYVAGQTFSTQFSNNVPFSTVGVVQTNYHGGNLSGDAFAARFDNSGTNLIYATYLGGTGNDGILGLKVDASGNAFVTGFTDSPDFPTTNAIKSTIGGQPNPSSYPVDAFVAELNPSGSQLIYSTYLGGSSMDAAWSIALDSSDNAYITGYSYSTNFPVTTNAFQPALACLPSLYYNANAFVAKISTGGTNLSYSTYLGGTNFDVGRAIAVNNGRVFVAGYTFSTNFPTTNALAGFDQLNGSSSQYNAGSDAFVTAFTSSVTNLSMIYSTLLGGSNYDAANGIAADAEGNAYVCGYTTSTNFPYTTTNVTGLATAYVHTNTSWYINATNGFLTQIQWDGTQPTIGYSAMFGGLGLDVANAVTLDADGNAYVVGSATSTNFPATTNNISGYLTATNNSQANQGYSDAFIIAFNTNASALLYSAYIGGYLQDYGNAIAVDPLGNAYIAGQTLSANFPTVNARQSYRNGTSDMFISKISQVLVAPAPLLTISPQASAPSGVNLKWQMFPDNFNLESAADLTTSNWSVVGEAPVYSNGWYQVTVPTTNGLEFFRLHQN